MVHHYAVKSGFSRMYIETLNSYERGDIVTDHTGREWVIEYEV